MQGFIQDFFLGGEEFRKGATRLFDHTHFAETTPIWLKIVSGLELVTSIGRLMCITIERLKWTFTYIQTTKSQNTIINSTACKLPIKKWMGKIAVQLKSHGESEIACN